MKKKSPAQKLKKAASDTGILANFATMSFVLGNLMLLIYTLGIGNAPYPASFLFNLVSHKFSENPEEFYRNSLKSLEPDILCLVPGFRVSMISGC